MVAHTAAYMAHQNDANQVIPITIAGAVNALKAAYAEPSVKRFVLTSSSSAALGSLDHGVTVTEDRWNEKSIEAAWAGPPYGPDKPVVVYEASKTQSEQAVWKFHKENRGRRPDLVVNTGMLRFRGLPLIAILTAHSPPQHGLWAFRRPGRPGASQLQRDGRQPVERKAYSLPRHGQEA